MILNWSYQNPTDIELSSEDYYFMVNFTFYDFKDQFEDK